MPPRESSLADGMAPSPAYLVALVCPAGQVVPYQTNLTLAEATEIRARLFIECRRLDFIIVPAHWLFGLSFESNSNTAGAIRCS